MEQVKNYSQAVGFFCGSFPEEFRNLLRYFEEDRGVWTGMELEDLRKSIRIFIEEIYRQLEEFAMEKDRLMDALEIIIFYNLHDIIMAKIHMEFHKEDEEMFEKSKSLEDISAVQFGAAEELAIALPASIVELASLDTFRTPVEKMKCLCTCYDMIFAELKMAMIECIAESSEESCGIPVVNNCEITPILMNVLVKAKLKHLHSNLVYLECFGQFDENNKNIFEEFKFAYKRVCDLEETVEGKRIIKELEMGSFYEFFRENWENSLQANQTKRFTHLISKSLSEHR